jgi:hypothetical protein
MVNMTCLSAAWQTRHSVGSDDTRGGLRASALEYSTVGEVGSYAASSTTRCAPELVDQSYLAFSLAFRKKIQGSA